MALKLLRFRCIATRPSLSNQWANRKLSCSAPVNVQAGNSTSERIVFTDDGSTIVFWHPEQSFPYECSRPLPEQTEETNSVLAQDRTKAFGVFRLKSEEMVRQELMKITYTTKHRWFPRSRDKFAKDTPPDREYL